MDDSVKLTFDPSQFIQALEKLTEKINGFIGKTEKGVSKGLNEKTQKSTESMLSKIGSKMAVVSGMIQAFTTSGISLVQGMMGKAMSYIPEIGKTFSIAGDIIMKNLLWPLRKALLPILQKILDWVRDHRGMFVRMGEVIANVFRVIKTIATVTFNVLKSLVTGFVKTLQSSFNLKDFDIINFINTMLFKIAFLFTYMGAKLSPLADKIGKLLGTIGKDLKLFGDKFTKAFKTNFDFSSMERALETLNKLASNPKVVAFFEKFGEWSGKLLGKGLSDILNSYTVLFNSLDKIMNGDFTGVLDLFDKISSNATFGLTDKIKDWMNKDKDKKEIGKKNSPVPITTNDAIITKDGKVIHTHPDDNLIATKNLNSVMGGAGGNFNISMNLNVTEGSSKQAGQNFAQSFAQQMREELRNEMFRQGSK